MTRPQPSRPYRRHRRIHWTRRDRRARPPTGRNLLSVIPSPPRAVLTRLSEAMINRMDEIDGDPDHGSGNLLQDDEDANL